MHIKGPGWENEDAPLPSPVEAALGFYLHYRDERKLCHKEAFAAAVQQLMELFPDLTLLQAKLVAIEAIRSVRAESFEMHLS
jgi:hypothetical protein